MRCKVGARAARVVGAEIEKEIRGAGEVFMGMCGWVYEGRNGAVWRGWGAKGRECGMDAGVLRVRSEASEDASNLAEGRAGEKGPGSLFSRS